MRIYFSYNPGSSFENPMLDIKVESKNEMSHEEVLLSNNSKHQNKYSTKKFQKEKSKTYKKHQNPTNRYGNYLKCNRCESINHLASKCPNKGNSYGTDMTLLDSKKKF